MNALINKNAALRAVVLWYQSLSACQRTMQSGRACVLLQPGNPTLKSCLAFQIRCRVKNGIPRSHHRCPTDHAVLEGRPVQLTTCGTIGIHDCIGGGVILVQDSGIPDD